jgi:hypothetical protein
MLKFQLLELFLDPVKIFSVPYVTARNGDTELCVSVTGWRMKGRQLQICLFISRILPKICELPDIGWAYNNKLMLYKSSTNEIQLRNMRDKNLKYKLLID